MELKVGYTNSAHFECLDDLNREYVDFNLSYCGIEQCQPGFGFGPFIRTEYVLHVVISGKGIYQFGKNTYSLSANQAFLIPPGVSTYYEADKEDPWSYMWIGFSGLRIYECVTNAGFTEKCPVISISCTEALRDSIRQMLDAHQLTYANELIRTSQLLRFFSILIEDHQSIHLHNKSPDYPGAIYVKQAVSYLSHHYSERLKINDLANYIGINRSYLTNSFKKVMNMSPQEFLMDLRMKKAASLLQKTTLPISTIADHVGYKDPLSFSKIFKQKYGESPKNYRGSVESLVTHKQKGDNLENPRLPL